MLRSRVEIVQENLDHFLRHATASARPLHRDAPLREGSSLTARVAIEIFQDQLRSRLLDVVSRELKELGQSFYTISSAGHEQNAVLGTQLRLTDPCFLHYRSGALMMSRSRQCPGVDALLDTLLSFVASSEDPISGGRHKVWGSRKMWVPPQTSTIASHLPKAMGMAFALGRRRDMGLDSALPEDSIVLCSFGDASANHATALAGIRSARYAFRRGNPVPILFLCEDNRVGISVEKPRRWIADSFSGLSQLEYHVASGTLVETWDKVEKVIASCRSRRRPVFLRLPTVRLWGHAGSDVETTYRSMSEIEEIEAQDPLLANARLLVETGAASPGELRGLLENITARVHQAAEYAVTRPKLHALGDIVRPLARELDDTERPWAERPASTSHRAEIFGESLPELQTAPSKRTLAAHLNSALTDEMIRIPEILVFGEDVAKKGGVYYVTSNLMRRFGRDRVFDTLLDETTILGVAQGLAHNGLLPIPEIQYLAYLHNAIDQLRGEAASLSFFSNGQFQNPMVVRIAGFAYQRGFGGHFHNDNAIGALREIPGVLLATPSRGDDAARMLRGVIATAWKTGRVVCFVEPIALYHQKDLFEEGDGQWLFDYPAPGGAGSVLLPGEVGVYHPDHRDVLLVSYANGLRMCLRVARRLKEEWSIRSRVLDLRWLNPLPHEAIEKHAQECGAVFVADECRATGAGIADAVIARLAESRYPGKLGSARSADTYIPLGPAADLTLLDEDTITTGVRTLLEG